jgi:hypothetical protein
LKRLTIPGLSLAARGVGPGAVSAGSSFFNLLLAKPPRNVNLGNDRSAMFNKKAGHPRASPQCDSRWYASQNVLT